MIDEFSGNIQEDDFQIKPRTSLGEVARLRFTQAFEDAETMSIVRGVTDFINNNSNDDKVDHFELNEKYPDLEVPFNEPTSLEVAEDIYERQVIRREREEKIRNGDPESNLQKGVEFASSIAGNIIDPVGIATGVVIGAGVGKVLGSALSKGLGGRVVEGIAGNAISEFGIINPLSKAEQRDVDTTQSLINSVAGGTLIPVGFKAIGKSSQLLKKLAGFKDGHSKAALQVKEQLEAGKQADIQPLVKALDGEDLNELEVRQNANAPEQDIYYNKAFEDDVNSVKVEKVDPIKASEEAFKEVDEIVADLKNSDLLDEVELENIAKFKEEFSFGEKINEIYKATIGCVRGTI